MGYYTNFDLEVIEKKDSGINHIIELGKINDYGDDWNTDSVKWYSHHQDMLTYSLNHPDTLFKLSGEGENNDDLWIEYYRNGKCQQTMGVVVYNEFDESKLI